MTLQLDLNESYFKSPHGLENNIEHLSVRNLIKNWHQIAINQKNDFKNPLSKQVKQQPSDYLEIYE